MPQFIPLVASAALSTWGVVGGSVLTLFGTPLGLAASFMVRSAIGLALYALVPKQKTAAIGGYAAGGGGYAVSSNGTITDHQIIYGRTKVAGVRVYDSVTGGGQVLNRVIAFAGHKITAYDELYFDDDLLTLDGSGNVTSPSQYSGKAKVIQVLGDDSQAACAELMAEDPKWTGNHKLSGIAYLYVRLTYDQSVFPNGIPNVTAVIRGKPLYDPRTGTTTYSNNPALCVRDYIASAYGLGSPTTEINDAKAQVAANVCDETVEGQSRYTCNGAFTTDGTPIEILTNLVASMAGTMWFAQGKWQVIAGNYVAPTVFLDAGDLRSNLAVSTRHSRRDNYNTVKGTFRGPVSKWNDTDFPPVTDSAFVDADNGTIQAIDISLPFTTNELTAQRVSRVMLLRNRQQLSIKATFGLKAFKCQIGDIVGFNYPRFGWSNKEFEVVEWTFVPNSDGDLQIDMTLREISADVFTNVPGSVLELDNSGLGNAFTVPSIGLSVVSDIRSVSESITNVIVITASVYDASSVDYVEVQIQKVGATNWVLVGSGLPGVFEYPIADRSDYNIRARAVSVLGVKGDYTTITGFDVDNILTKPSDVGAVTTSLNNSHVVLSWPAVSDASLSYYIVRHAMAQTGAIWTDSTILVEKVPRPASSVSVPALPGTYMVKAVDKFGNMSQNASMVVLPAVPERGTVLTQSEHPSFAGTKFNATAASSTLRITSYPTAPAFGGYIFGTNIDTGAVRECQVRIDLSVALYRSGGSDWDSIPGRWDAFVGSFDSWGVSSPDGDLDVVVYVSTTNDDPAGAPTWSPYVKFRGGIIKARAFAFKIDLVSRTDAVTPSIDYLQARVEY